MITTDCCSYCAELYWSRHAVVKSMIDANRWCKAENLPQSLYDTHFVARN